MFLCLWLTSLSMTLLENTLNDPEIQKKAELVRSQETSESEVTRREISRKLRVPPGGGKLSWVRVKQTQVLIPPPPIADWNLFWKYLEALASPF